MTTWGCTSLSNFATKIKRLAGSCASRFGIEPFCQPLHKDRDLLWKQLDNYCEIPPLLADTLSFKFWNACILNAFLGFRLFAQLSNSRASTSSLIISNTATEGIVSLGMNEAFIDIGAYDGDTVRQFFNITRGKYDCIWAFEPDPKSFESSKNLCNVIPNAKAIQAAVSNKAREVEFVARGTMVVICIQACGIQRLNLNM